MTSWDTISFAWSVYLPFVFCVFLLKCRSNVLCIHHLSIPTLHGKVTHTCIWLCTCVRVWVNEFQKHQQYRFIHFSVFFVSDSGCFGFVFYFSAKIFKTRFNQSDRQLQQQQLVIGEAAKFFTHHNKENWIYESMLPYHTLLYLRGSSSLLTWVWFTTPTHS